MRLEFDADDPLTDFPGMTIRGRNVLERLGIKTARDLAARTEAELQSARGCGWTTMDLFREALDAAGLRFSDPIPGERPVLLDEATVRVAVAALTGDPLNISPEDRAAVVERLTSRVRRSFPSLLRRPAAATLAH